MMSEIFQKQKMWIVNLLDLDRFSRYLDNFTN